jgi:uncharacterized protein (DUF302 family)
MLSPLVLGCALAPLACARGVTLSEDAGAPGPADGVVTVRSAYGADDTQLRLLASLQIASLAVELTVDQAAEAGSAGVSLPPTRLILFSDPQRNARLLQSTRTVGLDLPQKLLIWQEAAGQVFVSYEDPAWIAERHGIDDEPQVIDQMTRTLELVVSSVATP